MARRRWAVFISGTGSNLKALLEESPRVDIRLVVSSTEKAFGLLKARRAGVPTLTLGQPINWESLLESLKKHQINSIFLLGFMKIVPAKFLSQFPGEIVNLHPSLLPAYPGLNVIEKAYADHAPLGCTVHHVVPEVDAGQIIAQRRVLAEESLAETEFMVHLAEQRLIRSVGGAC